MIIRDCKDTLHSLGTCVVSPLLLQEAVEVEVAGDVDKVHEEQEDLHAGHHTDQGGRPLKQHHMWSQSVNV